MAPAVQRAPFCPCVKDLPWTAGLCYRCYRAASHSRHRFAGLRQEILEHDRRYCRACDSAGLLHVQHRKPGLSGRGCHAHLHRLGGLRAWIPERLVALWSEQHPGTPVQLQLPVAA